jgi:hypothetical protein
VAADAADDAPPSAARVGLPAPIKTLLQALAKGMR